MCLCTGVKKTWGIKANSEVGSDEFYILVGLNHVIGEC